MKRMFLKMTLALSAMAVIAGCGGAGGSGGAVDPATILSALDKTNVSSTGFPWNGQSAGVLKRWALPIPVKLNNEPRAIKAVDEIERQLGMTVFDRTSIASTPDANITRGLIVSVGTAYNPPNFQGCGWTGNASAAPNFGGYPSPFLNGAEISARLYINLDNAKCKADDQVVVHEFGHALGMGAHYEGFGDGDAISPLYWKVLKTIYTNPVGTAKSGIKVAE